MKTPTRDEHGRYAKYAWPGGYPIFYVNAVNEVQCANCANLDDEENRENPVTAADINWEDEALQCDGCGNWIESAYGRDE